MQSWLRLASNHRLVVPVYFSGSVFVGHRLLDYLVGCIASPADAKRAITKANPCLVDQLSDLAYKAVHVVLVNWGPGPNHRWPIHTDTAYQTITFLCFGVRILGSRVHAFGSPQLFLFCLLGWF